MYTEGGNEIKAFDFESSPDYSICYAIDMDEFIRIVDYLQEQGFVKWEYKNKFMSGGRVHYTGVQLKDLGVNEVLKEIPKIPMIGLVSQEISTGNPEIDN